MATSQQHTHITVLYDSTGKYYAELTNTVARSSCRLLFQGYVSYRWLIQLRNRTAASYSIDLPVYVFCTRLARRFRLPGMGQVLMETRFW